MSETYVVWTGMLRRARSETFKNYENIGVCEDWLNFEKFLEDMGERPENTSLDRIDVFGHYCKDNCRWATRSIQNHNKRKRKNCSSKYTGVSFNKKSLNWRAYITKDNITYRIGVFENEIDAAIAYDLMAVEIYGEFATTNKSLGLYEDIKDEIKN